MGGEWHDAWCWCGCPSLIGGVVGLVGLVRLGWVLDEGWYGDVITALSAKKNYRSGKNFLCPF